jgi:uncharacterized YccA/Bax inhibitor family protein
MQQPYPMQPQGYGPPPAPYASPVVAVGDTDRMTVDDVVVRTVGLLALTVLSGALAWVLVPDTFMTAAWIGGALVGLGIGLFISFKRITSPPLFLAYAVAEGVFVGLFSKFYEQRYPGIVLEAAIGTLAIFTVMTMLYHFGVIRNSPRFARGVISAMIGLFAIIMVNFGLSLFGVQTGIRGDSNGGGGTLAIVFSLVVIVVASLTFILDFDLIEKSVAAGAPKAMAWTCAFGLLVGLIWVYIEVVRLLGYLRGR